MASTTFAISAEPKVPEVLLMIKVLEACEVAGDQSGYSVSSAGDVNGDGLDDLIVGAWRADPSSKSSAGKSYVVFGKANSHLAINNKATIQNITQRSRY
jgi:hypothetical protein